MVISDMSFSSEVAALPLVGFVLVPLLNALPVASFELPPPLPSLINLKGGGGLGGTRSITMGIVTTLWVIAAPSSAVVAVESAVMTSSARWRLFMRMVKETSTMPSSAKVSPAVTETSVTDSEAARLRKANILDSNAASSKVNPSPIVASCLRCVMFSLPA